VQSVVVRSQGRPFVSLPKPEDLATLLQMVEAGQLSPVIDHSVPLEDTAAAIAHVAEGHNRGTTVITMPVAAEATGEETASA
jgi:NADPH:quinone reductase-like Zn-dependent oxidoreductase